jgi:hypothetical protein
MTIMVYKVILGEDYTFAKIPYKDLFLQWDLHFLDFLIIRDWQFVTESMIYTLSLLRIFHSHVNTNRIHLALALIGPFANRCSKEFQDASLGPVKSFLNDTFGGFESNTFVIVLLLWHTMLYRAGYCSRGLAFSIHLSSQNLIKTK